MLRIDFLTLSPLAYTFFGEEYMFTVGERDMHLRCAILFCVAKQRYYLAQRDSDIISHCEIAIIKQIRIRELAHKDGCADCSASAPFQRSIARSAATLLRARIGVYVAKAT